ncbi:hypothetical protein HDU76_001996 [Blyttiomyces sp. JEL0837]|nr:hypothetical protein HDU76_001996 [Blyttiomyces sp. JEL0837]
MPSSFSLLALASSLGQPLFQSLGITIAIFSLFPPKTVIPLIGTWPATFVGIGGSEIPGMMIVLNALSSYITYRMGGYDYIPSFVSRPLSFLYNVAYIGIFLMGFTSRNYIRDATRAFIKGIRVDGKFDNSDVEPPVFSLSFLAEALNPLWEPWNLTHKNDITYATPEEIEAAGPGALPFLQLDVIRKHTGYKNRPILMYIHGGAWRFGDKRKPPMGRTLPRMIDRVNLYDMILDLKRCIRWIRQNPSIHGGDPNFIAVSGGSAGGHLAALLATTQNHKAFQPGFENVDTSIQALVPVYGAFRVLTGYSNVDRAGFPQYFRRAIVKINEEESRERIGCEIEGWADPFGGFNRLSEEERKKFPPTFIVQYEYDTLVPKTVGKDFYTHLKSAGIPVGHLEIPMAHHGFDSFTSPRTLYTNWAIGHAMEALYENYKEGIKGRN